MKELRFIVSLFFLFLIQQNMAQVGIGTNDPKALLDISAGVSTDFNDGLLVPRIEEFPTVNPGAEQNGMLIFLDTASGSNYVGFYFWNSDTNSWNEVGKEGYWAQSALNGRPYIFYQNAQSNNSIPIRFFEDGYVGLGTAEEPVERLELKNEGNNNVQLTSSDPEKEPELIFFNQRGTFGSPEYLNFDETIGALAGKTWDGTTTSEELVGISFKAAQNHSEDNLPTKMEFATTARNAAAKTVQMTLESSGELRLNQLNSLNNNANDGVRPVPVYVDANGGLTLNGTTQILIEPSVKYTNSNTTTNLNVNPSTSPSVSVGFNLPILGNLQWNDDTNLFLVGSSSQIITVREAGRYNIVANIYFRADGASSSLECYVVVDPANGGPQYIASSIYANSYVGNSFNHFLSSISINEDIQIAAGDTISVRVKGNGNTSANIVMESNNTSMFQLTKIR